MRRYAVTLEKKIYVEVDAENSDDAFRQAEALEGLDSLRAEATPSGTGISCINDNV